MSKVLSAAKWSFELLSKRIEALRSRQSYAPNTSSIFAYDESQMKDDDMLKRQQKAEIEYECWIWAFLVNLRVTPANNGVDSLALSVRVFQLTTKSFLWAYLNFLGRIYSALVRYKQRLVYKHTHLDSTGFLEIDVANATSLTRANDISVHPPSPQSLVRSAAQIQGDLDLVDTASEA